MATPAWLTSLLEREPPTLYAWNTSNLDGISSKHAQRRTNSTTDDHERRVYILGMGNIGRLFATCLAKLPDRPPITLVVHREELLHHWASQPGIEITRAGVSEIIDDFDIELWSETRPAFGPARELTGIRNLVVTTKATTAFSEVDRARRYLDSNSTVAFAQNGMCKLWPPIGPAYTTARYGPAPEMHPNYLACVVGHGVFSQGPFKSTHAALLDVAVGRVLLNPETHCRADYLTGLITRSPHLAGREVPRPEFWVTQLEKLVVNCAINPLTAIFRCQNGALFIDAEPAVTRIMGRLLSEASGVLQALIKDNSSSEILSSEGSDLTREALLQRFSEEQLKDMVHKYGLRVAPNYSSMYQDSKAGKKTEIGDMNGWLIETEAWLGGNLDVTTNKTIVGLVEKGKVLYTSSLGTYFPGIDSD